MAILKRWREAGRRMPVLVLTARGSWAERVEAIDAGADDYLPKPFQVEEPLARLRAIIRRSSGHAAPVVRFGPLTLDQRQMRVVRNGVAVPLSVLEYRLVSYLMLNRGRVISQQELIDHVYGHDNDRESNAMEVLLGRVRRKLGANLIETRRGFGYLVPVDRE
jgi:DNA-binding response OmpR family regulator